MARPRARRATQALAIVPTDTQPQDPAASQTRELIERVKELNCLHDISSITGQPGAPLPQILQDAVTVIPRGWQYPDIVCARIIFEGQEYRTEDCEESAWKQTADILAHGEHSGLLEVCYLEERPERYEGPFLREERHLINTIARHLGNAIERHGTEQALRESEGRLSAMLESIADHMSMMDGDLNIIWANETAKRLFGDDLVGRKCYEAYHGRAEPCEPYPCLTLQAFQDGKAHEHDTTVAGRDGKPVYFHCTANVALRDDAGQPIAVIEISRDVTSQKEAEERIEHLNAVLHAIRNVNQLIVRERDPERLLQGVCDSLVETRGYHNAWMVLLDEAGGLATAAEAGLGDAFLPVVERGERGELAACARSALARSGALAIQDPSVSCVDCPLRSRYGDRGVMVVRLAHRARVYGLLSVSVPREFAADSEEGELFEQVAADVAFALHCIEVDERRKRAERGLERYAASLEQANGEMRRFTYIVSHDLRAPLVNLKGFAGELRSALRAIDAAMSSAWPLLDETQREAMTAATQQDMPEALGFIESSVTRMDGFINALLELSRAGRRELELEPIDMNALVQATLETLAHQIEERQVCVTVGSLPEVVADRRSLEQVLGNLLANAVAYLDPSRPGEIEITAEQRDDETLFRVRDNGRGIAAGNVEKVFAPFRRAGRQDVPGEGMGLAYVQALLRRHGGRIWCESEPGVGSAFTFTLASPVEQRGHHA